MAKLYDYQEKCIFDLNKQFEDKNRLLLQLPTGAGKTFVFSFFVKEWVKKHINAKVLILVHRDELLEQSARSLRKIGVTVETVTSKKKSLNHLSNCYVSMIETTVNRLKKDPDFFKDITLIIADECHILIFERVFKSFPNVKILGVTATPTVLKKVSFTKCSVCSKIHEEITECCNFETYEYTRKFTLSEIYEEIILGCTISQLIYNDRLVRDVNYEIGGIDRSVLTIDAKTGDYDSKSTDEYFGQFDVVGNYEAIAKGKKTIVFCSSAKTNLIAYKSFIDAGYKNVKLFDSVNETENRKKVIEWFENTPDAILLNVNCFTTGFDCPSLECVILNRATLSLSLFLQMVGRGGRKCDSIYKPSFTVIDGGGNIGVHGKWSDEIDWESHFYGTNEKAKPKKEVLEQVKQCAECGAIHAKNAVECPQCGYSEKENETEIKTSKEIAVLTDEIPLPNGSKIVDYCLRIGKDKNFGWLILQNQIIDLFIRHSVTFGTYQKSLSNEKFEQSIRRVIKEPYQTIQGSNLESGTMRTKAWLINKIKTKLDKYYETKGRKESSAGMLALDKRSA